MKRIDFFYIQEINPYVLMDRIFILTPKKLGAYHRRINLTFHLIPLQNALRH